jgi:hypothetical protein
MRAQQDGSCRGGPKGLVVLYRRGAHEAWAEVARVGSLRDALATLRGAGDFWLADPTNAAQWQAARDKRAARRVSRDPQMTLFPVE